MTGTVCGGTGLHANTETVTAGADVGSNSTVSATVTQTKSGSATG